ncbi:MAG: site-specific integrase [Rhizobacter sp.]
MANERFTVHGIPYPGFPLLLDDSMKFVEPAMSYLVEKLLRRGRARDPKTWEKYGRELYDFMSFVAANDLDWRRLPKDGIPSAVHHYANWSATDARLEPSTTNARLRTVRRFYEWALDHGLIHGLPWSTEPMRVTRRPGLLSHLNQDGRAVDVPDFMRREARGEIEILTKEQIASCIKYLAGNEVHTLALRLMLLTGLRNEEARTFPITYLCDPDKRSDLRGRKSMRIHLRPADMELKYDQERKIDIPISLMRDIYWWHVLKRPKLAKRADSASTSVLLTGQGNTFSRGALNKVFQRLSERVGFRVYPHILRHSYATWTLYALERLGFKGDALMYVRDRLGHASVATTQVYLHVLRDMEAGLILAHEDEIDKLFEADTDGR